MKRSIFMLFSVCSIFGTTAQEVKTRKMEIGKQDELKGVYFVMPKESTYKLVLGTNGGSPELEDYFAYSNVSGMKSKVVRPSKESDYTFEISTGGLQVVRANEFGTYGDITESVLNIQYTMSCMLTVKDKSGKTLKTFVIDDGNTVYTEPYYANFMEYYDNRSVIIPRKGFHITNEDSQLIVLNGYGKNKKEILQILERGQMHTYSDIYEHIIEYAYGRIKTGKPELLVMEDKYKSTYPELNSKIEELGTLTENMYNNGLDGKIQEAAKSLGNYFTGKMEESEGKDMAKLTAQNAFTAYTYGNEPEEAYRVYKAYESIDNSSWNFAFGRIGDTFDKFLLVNQLIDAKDEDSYTIQPIRTLKQRISDENAARKESESAAMAKRAAYNVDNKKGYYIDAEGNKIEGEVVSLEVMEDEASNVINLSFGKNFTFKPAGGNSRIIRENESKQIVVDGNVYEFADGRLAVVAYEKGNFQVMYDANYDRYMIKKKDGRKALDLYRFNNKDKRGIEFMGECQEAKNLVAGRKLKSENKDDAVALCNALASCQ